MKALILAGGSGERFWPLSTNKTPKQFLRLFSDKTLLQQTYARLRYRLPPNDIYVVTLYKYAQKTCENLPELPKKNVLLEPDKKNTAAACVFGTLSVEADNEIIFVVPADHYIPDVEKFWQTVEIAEEFLKENDKIITFGIKPSRYETEYGYIEAIGKGRIKNVKKFHEKPSYEKAKEYVDSGKFFWNSGMFMWRKDFFIEEMKKHSPEIIEPFLNKEDLNEVYSNVMSISIDHALMEKTTEISMVMAEFEWSDVGNWASLKELKVENTESVLVNSENVFVKATKPVVAIGIEGVVIVETDNGILVAKDDNLQMIREAVKRLRQE